MEPKTRPDHLKSTVWPEVVFGSDLSAILAIEEAEADRGIRERRFGPYFEVRGRPAVLRRDLLETLSQRAAGPDREVLG